MGCGPMLEFSGAMSEIEQAAMEARGLVLASTVYGIPRAKMCHKKLGACTNCNECAPTLEGVHIDHAPLLDWLKYRIDKCWHRGIELVEKAARPADEVFKQLKEALGGQEKAMQGAYSPRRHHGKLVGFNF